VALVDAKQGIGDRAQLAHAIQLRDGAVHREHAVAEDSESACRQLAPR
jgi:hypothetical protein